MKPKSKKKNRDLLFILEKKIGDPLFIYLQYEFCCCFIDDRLFISGLYFVTVRNLHALFVLSVMPLLLLDLKFITENNDSQEYVDEKMVNNAVARFFK